MGRIDQPVLACAKIFVLEIAWRLYMHKLKFLCDIFGVFDVLVVIATSIDVYVLKLGTDGQKIQSLEKSLCHYVLKGVDEHSGWLTVQNILGNISDFFGTEIGTELIS